MKYGDDWKQIASEMNIKNKKEVILEFLRIKPDYEFGTSFLVDHAYQSNNNEENNLKSLKDTEPYN